MATNRLNEAQTATYNKAETHGYGLGVCTSKEGGRHPDYGWGGAAGAHYAIDPENDTTMYLAMHLLSSPVQGLRSQVFDLVVAELQDNKMDVQTEPSDYHLTY